MDPLCRYNALPTRWKRNYLLQPFCFSLDSCKCTVGKTPSQELIGYCSWISKSLQKGYKVFLHHN